MVHPHSGLLFIPKQEGNSDICYSMDESRRHYVKQASHNRTDTVVFTNMNS